MGISLSSSSGISDLSLQSSPIPTSGLSPGSLFQMCSVFFGSAEQSKQESLEALGYHSSIPTLCAHTTLQVPWQHWPGIASQAGNAGHTFQLQDEM